MQCPSCWKEMSEEQVGGILVDVCRECPAVWFDAGELQALHAGRDRQAAKPYPVDPSSFVAAGTLALLRCRRCSAGHLQAGTIGERKVLRCDRCDGCFVPLPGPSGINAADLRPWLEIAANELIDWVWVVGTAAPVPR